jgi:hypothetical protein
MRGSWLLLCLLAACGPNEVRVTMNPDNNSGQAGFAVLTQTGAKKLRVVVETSAPDLATDQRAHIHEGTCGEIGPIRAGLSDLKALPEKPGRFGSTTDVEGLDLEELSTGEWAINVHDPRDNAVYTSCGEIRVK